MTDNPRIRWTMQAARGAVMLALVLSLASCATAPTYTSEDIALAESEGQLEEMFNQVKSESDSTRPGSSKALALDETLSQIAVKLSAPHQQIIDEMLAEARRRPLSLAEVEALERELATVRQWMPYHRPELRYEVANIRSDTEELIKDIESQLAALDQEQGGERYLLFMDLAELTGGSAGEAMRAEANQSLESLYQTGIAAVQGKQLSSARGSLNQVAVADPDYKELVYYQELVATGLFEQHFWQALVDGRPAEAFTLFYEFAETPAFATHRGKVAKDAAELAEYFDALGDKSRREKRWLESYESFRKSVYVRDKLEIDAKPSVGMQRFILEMENRFNQAEKSAQAPAALAYLSIIESLYPQHALIERKQRASFEAVFDQAVVKVSVEKFSGDYGRQMASGISRYLLDTVPNEVRMVNREQFQLVDSTLTHSAAYFMLEGEMLRADVEQQEQDRGEKRNVVVGTEPGPNPLHKAWKKLPRAERKQTPEPPEETNLPVYAEVQINHKDMVRKAVMTVSYQVVDPTTAKVLFVENVTDSITVEGTATDGLVKGDYEQAPTSAGLPSDSKMFEQLVGLLSEQIGAELAARLLALESRYEAAAIGEVEQSNYVAATDQWAYAYAVSEPESDASVEYRQEMELAVLKN